jgi:hypothetical protein
MQSVDWVVKGRERRVGGVLGEDLVTGMQP